MRRSALERLTELRARHEAELHELLIASAREGATADQIARALRISRSTVWRRYGKQLRQAKPEQPERAL